MNKSDINILIVDDDESIRKVLSELVQRAGYKAVAVARADEALSAVKIKPIHGALIDCLIPGKNGVDLAIELRGQGLDHLPIILFSGIYRDKVFANDSIKKVGAVEFLHKPIDVNKLLELLEQTFSSVLAAPKVAIHSLLSKPYASQRDRRKALDHVEEILGYDLPMVLCILMDAESSGHLNLVNSSEEIFGITLAKGKIARLDSNDTLSGMSLLLIEKGYLKPTEIREYQDLKRKGDFLEGLVEESFISPHVAELIRKEQIFSDLRRLVTDEYFKINFVPDRRLPPELGLINLSEFTPVLQQFVEVSIPEKWLENFYEPWRFHPILRGPQFSDSHQIVSLSTVGQLKGLLDDIKEEPTIADILDKRKYPDVQFYRAIHMLALRRLIVFDEQSRMNDFSKYGDRLKKLLADLSSKDPMEIFHYFGASANPKQHEVVRIYKDFAKSNHPDTLPSHAPEEIRELNHKVFSLVSDAHDILTNEERRAKFLDQQNRKKAEQQLKAEQLLEEGITMLRQNRLTEAVQILSEAVQRTRSEHAILHWVWARSKAGAGHLSADDYQEMEKLLESIPHQNRRNGFYWFVYGLLNKAIGDNEVAANYFQKSLQFDPKFVEAKRELTTMKASGTKTSATNIFTADLTTVAKNLFKKKLK